MKYYSGEEAARLFTGRDKWCTREACGIPSMRTSDGPNGLRIEKTRELGFSESHPATAFPTACCSACSFDPDLQYEMGKQLARECGENNVQVLLGPGINHKRSPLCGRNFEYYSEDPLLSSELAASYIKGLQDHGVAACLKHFAANSREYGRSVYSSLIDERALHELYLRAFERVVKKSHPWAMMCAYNQLNGTYCCENKELMDKARSWGFDGIFISDWGGVADPARSFAAGLNLEMPGGERGSERRILKAVEEGKTDPSLLEQEAEAFERLSERTAQYHAPKDLIAERNLSRTIAEESAVLLKNENELPLSKDQTLALIGAFAKNPRIQGAGSSQVNPKNHDCLYDVLKRERIPFSYARGYHTHTSIVDPILEEQALLVAEKASRVIVILGLSEGDEAEGYDRRNMKLAENQLHLLDAVLSTNPHVTVVLECGAPVELPFRNRVSAILCMYLAGAASGEALYRLLYGIVSPSGHLSESWPDKGREAPCAKYFDEDIHLVQYRESIFSGYRYYEKAGIEPAYAFGYGLSYTRFELSGLSVKETEEGTSLTLKVSNAGKRSGKAVVQIYTGMKESRIMRPVKELAAFRKVNLNPGESEDLSFLLAGECFSYYDVKEKDWRIEEGIYRIFAGFSSDDIRLEEEIYKQGTQTPYTTLPDPYFTVDSRICRISDENFETALGFAVPKPRDPRPFTVNSTFAELRDSFRGKWTNTLMAEVLKRKKVPGVRESMVFDAPIRNALWFVQRWDTVDALVDFFNGKGSLLKVLRAVRRER